MRTQKAAYAGTNHCEINLEQITALEALPKWFWNLHQPSVDCTCQTCGKQFTAEANVVKKGGGKHCSSECYHNASRKAEGDVTDIKRRLSEGNVTQTQLAKEYGVSQTTISNIARGKFY